MEVSVEKIEEFNSAAELFARNLTPRTDGATLVTLTGELGAGKTAFVKAIAKTFGVEEIVNSPTFVLEKIYTLPNAPFKRLVHIDAYRLNGGAELTPLAFDEFMRNPENLIMLEWPERVAEALPRAASTISIQLAGDTRRIIYG